MAEAMARSVSAVEQLREEVARLKAEAEAKDEADRAFKAQVVAAALKGKEQHGWCSEIDTILEGLGLEAPPTRMQATFTVRLTFDTEPKGTDHDDNWWTESVSIMPVSTSNGYGYLVRLDSDHNNVSTIDDSEVLSLDSVEPIEND